MAGLGVVSGIFSKLPGYRTGGTIHVVVKTRSDSQLMRLKPALVFTVPMWQKSLKLLFFM